MSNPPWWSGDVQSPNSKTITNYADWGLDIPAPRRDDGGLDIPAPKRNDGGLDIPTPKRDDGGLDIPTPSLDPTFLGWFTTAAYFATAIVCFRAAMRTRRKGDQRIVGRCWFVAGVGTGLLGANKELDLQTVLIRLTRQLAESEGWLPYRRTVQRIIVIGITAALALMAFNCVRRHRYLIRSHKGSVLGVLLITAYVAVRAAGFGSSEFSLADNWLPIIEVAGLTFLFLGAIRHRSEKSDGCLSAKSENK